MAETYEIGGILKVLHSSNVKDDDKTEDITKSSEDEDEDEDEVEDEDEDGSRRTGDILMDLFTLSTETEVAKTFETQHIVDNEVDDVLIDSKTVDDQDKVKKKKKKQKDSAERLERTLFVGNVSLNVTRKTLKKIFVKFGEIENLRFRSFTAADAKVPKKVAIIKKTFHSECKSMNAYIVYKSKESVGKALVCNGMVVEDLHLRVDKASPDKQHKNKQALFVGNLPFNIAEESVYKHFEQCGEIDYIRLIRDKSSGMGKGIGYVTFKNTDGVVFGLKLNGSTLNGRPIRVCRSESSPKNQFNKRNVKNQNQNQIFCGFKSTTSKKDREKGKKLVQEKRRTSSNAMRRIKTKVGTKRKNVQEKNNQKISRKR